MRTIAIVRYGSPGAAFEFRDSPAPEPQPGQVLIKVDAFGLNFADVMARKGLYREAPKPPFVPGYEVVGRIEKPGAGITHFSKGQRVAASPGSVVMPNTPALRRRPWFPFRKK